MGGGRGLFRTGCVATVSTRAPAICGGEIAVELTRSDGNRVSRILFRRLALGIVVDPLEGHSDTAARGLGRFFGW